MLTPNLKSKDPKTVIGFMVGGEQFNVDKISDAELRSKCLDSLNWILKVREDPDHEWVGKLSRSIP